MGEDAILVPQVGSTSDIIKRESLTFLSILVNSIINFVTVNDNDEFDCSKWQGALLLGGHHYFDEDKSNMIYRVSDPCHTLDTKVESSKNE